MQRDVLMRSYANEGATDTLIIAFGGLQQSIGGGGGGGVPPWEFVRSCQRAGARHALFVKDPLRCCQRCCPGSGAARAEKHAACSARRASPFAIPPFRGWR